MKPILCDPQTSGGLLIAVKDSAKTEVEALLKKNNMSSDSFGYLTEKKENLITVL
jgi:selenide,water dikinase